VCTLPLTTAHTKVGTLTFASKAPNIYSVEEVHFLSVVAEQIALAFDNALHFDAAPPPAIGSTNTSARITDINRTGRPP
jgi:hypothetical protein